MFTVVMAKLKAKIEIVLKNGAVDQIKLQKVAGRNASPATQSKHFKNLATLLADEIVQSWVNYFIYHKQIVPKNIAGKL